MAKSGNTQKLSKNLRIKLKLKLSLESSALKMKLKQVELSTLDMRPFTVYLLLFSEGSKSSHWCYNPLSLILP